MKALIGAEISLSSVSNKPGAVIRVSLQNPEHSIVIRKRLSLHEYKHRHIRWYAREDELYHRLFPSLESFAVEIEGKIVQNRQPDFEKRILVLNEALRVFQPGEDLLIYRSCEHPEPTLKISREQPTSDISRDSMTTLRSLVLRLISRPLSEFNEGEVKALIALLDETKTLWEKITSLREENEKLKEGISTLESVFEQFSKNVIFECKLDFTDWVVKNLQSFEKGIRVIHRNYAIKLDNGKDSRVDLLCQDRKGVLVAIEIVFNPSTEDVKGVISSVTYLRKNIESLGHELSSGRLKATSIRGMVIANREKPELVEMCIQNNLKLCVLNHGYFIDVIE
ncbi:DUF91 domain-containing protein [bacterium]|nr:DUF91 domain-containing protein [bacterium]